MIPRAARKVPRVDRRAKEATLLALDVVTAHNEIRPHRDAAVAALVPRDDVRDFLDWFERDCPEYNDRMRAVPRERIEAALAAWKHTRGQKARASKHESTKMGAVAALLAELSIACAERALSQLWTDLVKAGRAHWRGDEWFLSWGARRRASDR